MTPAATGAFDLGAGVIVLVSPARSASVFRLPAGSGTIADVSRPCPTSCLQVVHQQFDPCLLWPAIEGGGIAIREFVAAALISAIARWGLICPYRMACGRCDANWEGMSVLLLEGQGNIISHSRDPWLTITTQCAVLYNIYW